ncbi:MAG: DUF5686 and carboxypeptidase regulatory-like domain-containing protein [candidate division KSB1 bacterium]|nr:DUF5686 and carboxypeptidase regulatory-like domain-containing protein [candidate division KSB1 bacterium]
MVGRRGWFVERWAALWLVLLLESNVVSRVSAQGARVHGTVRDARTGQPLALANIWVEGTYRGTTTNSQGEYVLEIPSVPATLRVRYIGYRSQGLAVTAHTGEQVNFDLEPVLVELPPVVVTGEDPAVAIMREVIRRKQHWRSQVRTFAAEAYSRLSVANDTAVVMVMESTSRLFWDRDRGVREIVRSRRQTKNVPAPATIFAMGFPNFYDDDVEVLGNRFVGVTHPDALDYYQFHLQGTRGVDRLVVFDIAVKPKGQLQPCFEGTISVLDSVYALIAVDLRPLGTLPLPFPVQEWAVRHQQHFGSFEREFWLPVDAYERGTLRVGVPGLYLPDIMYERLVGLADYQINVPLPDTLYARPRVVSVDSVAVRQDTLLAHGVRAVPLTEPELVAYERVDSTWTLSRMYRPKGPLARLVKTSVRVEDDGARPAEAQSGGSKRRLIHFAPDLRFNRVEALHLGARYALRLAKQWEAQTAAGYKTGPHKWSYALGLGVQLAKNHRLSVQHMHDVVSRPGLSVYPQVLHSVLSIMGPREYFDYFWLSKTGISLESRVPRWHLRMQVGIGAERDRSARACTGFSLFRRREEATPNPPVQEGRLGLLRLNLRVGDPSSAWGIIAQRGAEVEMEQCRQGFFGSDFSFVSYRFRAVFGTPTFLRRRMLPNRLDIVVLGGLIQGHAPVQRLGTVEGRMAFLAPFGVLRTLEGWYHGRKYLGLFWEHNFRTLPFELVGLRWLVVQGVGVVLHGATARTWGAGMSEFPQTQSRVPARFHQEIGLSLTGLLGVGRCDVSWRLDQRGWSIGLGLARLY